MSNPRPRSLPLACGAIGRFDRRRVEAVARCFERTPAVRVDEPGAVLRLDRPPRAWSAGAERGFAWGRTLPPGRRRSSWRDAAAEGDCGLVLGRSGPFLHSSTAGVVPLYWRQLGGAVYFASRLDPLVRGTGPPLSVDWDAWAGLLACGCVLGERTPFRECRRLSPQATLAVGAERAVEERERWPWLDVEPSRTVAAGAGPLLEALRAVVARAPGEPAAIGLSGGLDSRILAALAAERGIELTGITVDGDSGNDGESRAASAVAAALGIPQEVVERPPERYFADADDRGLRGDYERTASAWLAPAHRRLGEWPSVALDGLGGDVLCDRSRYLTRAMLDERQPRVQEPLWRALRAERAVRLAGPLGGWVTASARRQIRQCTRELDGHPNRGALAPYLTRIVGGVARVSLGSLGTRALVETPFTSDEVAREALAVGPQEKFRASLRRAVLELVRPELAAIPTNHDPDPARRPRPRRRAHPTVLAGYRRLLGAGPLGPALPAAAHELLERGVAPPGQRSRRLWRAIDGVATYHLWLRRYGELVSGAEPPGLDEGVAIAATGQTAS